MAPTVIVFGPTGNIGSFAARAAHEHGAKVYLAMRDPSKTIPGLSKQQEQDGGYVRIQADLSRPETVAEAIKTSQATRAFVYLAHGTQDHMKATFEAMKSAGLEFVVFLSSFTVPSTGKLEDVPQSEFISYGHARVEMSLRDVFGIENFVAVRPGGFATNILRITGEIAAGDVGCFGEGFRQDCITPGDMGAVSGYILAKGPLDGDHGVYLFGPRFMNLKEQVAVISKVLGKDIKTHSITAEEAVEQQVAAGIPKFLAQYLVDLQERMSESSFESRRADIEAGTKNKQRYTGEPPETFEHWVEANKSLFTA